MAQSIANKGEAHRCIDIVKQRISKDRVNWEKVEKLIHKSLRLYATYEAKQILVNLPRIKHEKELNKPKYDPALKLPLHTLIVTGFIRCNYFEIFPRSMINACVMFYQSDEFCIVSGIASLSIDKQTVNIDTIQTMDHSKMTFYGASFLSISKRVYEWKIQWNVNENAKHRLTGYMYEFCVGVASTIKAKERSIVAGYRHPQEHYYVYSSSGATYRGIGDCDVDMQFSRSFTFDDVIGVRLDLNKREIVFSKNEKSFSVAHSIHCDVDVEYRLAVSFDSSAVSAVAIRDFRVQMT
eukprot:266490_1